MEITTGMMFMGAAIAVAGIAAITDARTGHIPNWLTLPALTAGPAAHFVLSGADGLTTSLLGLLLCGIVPYLLFRSGAMGGGDVKLFAALGAILGFGPGGDVLLLSFVIAGLTGVAVWIRHSSLRAVLGNITRDIANRFRSREARKPLPDLPRLEMRMGPAVLVAVLLLNVL
jgi:prepilin peptidase CpaA